MLSIASACSTPKPPSAFETDFDEQAKPWTELQAQLPKPPATSEMLPFGVSGATEYRFAIDRASLSIGTDGVFRYTLVATSPQGARNVSYEGIRCETAQKKIYATGRNDGTWVRARNSAWTPIEEVGINRQHAALMKEYFCPGGSAQQRIGDVVGRLERRLPSTVL